MALTLAATIAAALSVAPSLSAATQYRVLGKGWGHGIGMSQYGAKGLAENGRTHVDIVQHYYQGSTVSDNAVPTPARQLDVLLKQGVAAAAFEVDKAGVRVVNGTSSWETRVGDVLTAKVESGTIGVYRKRGTDSTQLLSGVSGTVSLTGVDGALQTRFTADNGFYGHHYRGSITLSLSGSTLMVINRVGMEQYLRSVVPDEMPASWHEEALRAQAIAARSYAVATRKTGTFDAYADTRSQMYGGMQHETARTDAAVSATAGKAAVHSGVVIPTFFHSTSGGRTASLEHVWNSAPRAYLTSVPDPYERSPYSNWHLTYSPAAFERAWGGVPGRLRNVTVSLNGSRRVRTITAVGSGGSRTLAGTSFQWRLGLRSTHLRIERLVLNASAYTAAPGGRVRLTGTVPRSRTTRLVYRNAGSPRWYDAGALTISTTGSFVRKVRVANGRTFALKRGGRLGPAVMIRVS